MNIKYSVLALAFSAAIPLDAYADCFDDAGNYHQVNPTVLRAIAWQESRGIAQAINRNRNGSIDYGMMQINSIHLRALSAYRISTEELMNPCISVYVAAWHLQEKIRKYGNTWDAVGAYHSETPDRREKYKNSILKIISEHGSRTP